MDRSRSGSGAFCAVELAPADEVGESEPNSDQSGSLVTSGEAPSLLLRLSSCWRKRPAAPTIARKSVGPRPIRPMERGDFRLSFHTSFGATSTAPSPSRPSRSTQSALSRAVPGKSMCLKTRQGKRAHPRLSWAAGSVFPPRRGPSPGCGGHATVADRRARVPDVWPSRGPPTDRVDGLRTVQAAEPAILRKQRPSVFPPNPLPPSVSR